MKLKKIKKLARKEIFEQGSLTSGPMLLFIILCFNISAHSENFHGLYPEIPSS